MDSTNRIDAMDCIELLDDEARVVVGGPTAVEYAFGPYTGPELSRVLQQKITW